MFCEYPFSSNQCPVRHSSAISRLTILSSTYLLAAGLQNVVDVPQELVSLEHFANVRFCDGMQSSSPILGVDQHGRASSGHVTRSRWNSATPPPCPVSDNKGRPRIRGLTWTSSEQRHRATESAFSTSEHDIVRVGSPMGERHRIVVWRLRLTVTAMVSPLELEVIPAKAEAVPRMEVTHVRKTELGRMSPCPWRYH